MNIHSYSSPINLASKDTQQFFLDGEYVVTEKIDGSQFSFGIYDGVLACRSHGQQINLDQPPKMFVPAVETVKLIADKLMPGWTYRGETLCKKQHNILKYDRVPKGNIILFDIEKNEEDYLTYDIMQFEADHIGLEVVPAFGTFTGIPKQETVDEWLSHESILGGTKIEGVVLKNYVTKARDGKLMMVKIVSPKFRETHVKEAKPQDDIVTQVIDEFGSEARWAKAVQHLSEEGLLKGDPSDIGPLLREISQDFEKEETNEIKNFLWAQLRKSILRGISAGFPEWYKQQLLNNLYSDDSNDSR